MGLLDGLRSVFQRNRQPVAAVDTTLDDNVHYVETIGSAEVDISGTYNNRNITYRGDLNGFDYDRLLKDKQNWENFVTLCKLSDYYVDKDPLFRGIVKEVYTPFSIADDWTLIGSDEKIKKKYADYYKSIHFDLFLESVFYQFWKYSNVVIYIMPDASLITLPFHMTRIENVTVDGQPLVEYHCRAAKEEYDKKTYATKKDYVDDIDLDVRLAGLPPEVKDGIKNNVEWVQLNPKYTYVFQDIKEEWQRYCPPLVTTMLSAFRKKELISQWEDSQLNLGIHSFLHVQYGDPSNEVLPDKQALTLVGQTFKAAMTKGKIAVTNNWAKAEFLQPDLDEIFSDDKYRAVNSDILDAGGISGIIVSGRAEDGSTFASAQVSMQTAAMRIKRAKNKFCDIMDKINQRINDVHPSFPHNNGDRIPLFRFPPTDLTGDQNFLKVCDSLYAKGMLSNETYLSAYKFDYQQEINRKRIEKETGIDELFTPVTSKSSDNGSSNSNSNVSYDEESKAIGRPTLDENERHSDPSKSVTGRQPKGSNPAGSEQQESTE